LKKLILLLLFILISCNNYNIEKKWNSANNFLENKNLREAITIYKEIITKYPSSDYAVKSQFQIAEIYLNDKKEYDIAIDKFNLILKNHPTSNEAKNALFMISYIYNNYLNSYSHAIHNYNLFLKKYPEDDLAPSVKYELQGLKKYKNQIDSLNNIIR
tara:strand:+ start:129 stop:602 length:474 start_codon:yes stop_codon:yes gene_type:complete